MRKRLRRRGLIFSLAAVTALVATASALAANVPATVTVNAGTLSLTSSATPSASVTLNGADQTPTYDLDMAVDDSTGSGTGWNVTITSTRFTTGGGSPRLLSATASDATGVTSACASGSTCTNATNGVSYPVAVPAGSGPPLAVKLFNAAVNTGMGTLDLLATIQVAIPANTYAGVYTSTVTLAVVSGP